MLIHLLRVCSKKHGKMLTNRTLVLRAISSFTNHNALPSTSKSFSKLSKWKLQKNCLKFSLIEIQNILSHWTLLRFATAVEQLQNILLAKKTAHPKASKPVRRSKESGHEVGGMDDENNAEKGTKKPGRMEQQNGMKKKGKQQNENNGLGDDEKESAEKRRLEQDQRSDREFEDVLKILEKMFGKQFTDSFANSNREMFRRLNSDKQKEFGIANIVVASLFVLLIFAISWTMYQSSSRNKHPQSGKLQFPAEITWNYFLQNVANSGEICQIQINSKAVEQARTQGRKTGHIIVHMNLGATNRNGLPFAPTYRVSVPNLLKMESKIREIEEDAGIPYNRRADFQWSKVDTSLLTIIFGLFLLCLFGFPLFWGLRDIRKFGVGGFDRFSSMMPFKMKIIDTATKEGKKALKVKFRDVAGLHEAKVEISEFVDYLRRPQKYTKLGARLPKGALLTGPPGCGKTLLAKALAAESSVPFININGTEFVEMIGGLGASRVRQLFKTAKSRAPCIIYIDEIEAIGRARKDKSFGGHQEMEQTLNQLLVEMDGMDSSGGIVVIGSTNRADILDKALLRPGRFDRHVSVDLPTLLERRETFDLYLQKIKKENSLTGISHRLAQMTPGFSGADIANVVNEAAIHAATEQKKMVQMEDIDYAMEKIIAGPKKRSRVLVEEEREIVAWHESGHALVGWLLEHTEALLKVTIIPRTSATLGFAQYSPRDRKIFTKEELFDRMCMMLGGRAAENVAFGRITTGATNDLEKVTKNAQAMVKWYGMNELVGPLSFIPGPGTDERKSQFMEKPYSKKLGALIDQEVNKLVADAYYSTEKLLKENRDKLDKLAKTLLEKETLNYEDVKKLIGPPRYGDKNVVDLAEQVLPDPMKPDFSI